MLKMILSTHSFYISLICLHISVNSYSLLLFSVHMFIEHAFDPRWKSLLSRPIKISSFLNLVVCKKSWKVYQKSCAQGLIFHGFSPRFREWKADTGWNWGRGQKRPSGENENVYFAQIAGNWDQFCTRPCKWHLYNNVDIHTSKLECANL